jgi:hypothetical protein
MNRGDFFKGVMQWEFYHKEMERKFLLPVFYYDNTAMTCIYTAALSSIRGLLPRSEMLRSRSTRPRPSAFSAFEYLPEEYIDPYNDSPSPFPSPTPDGGTPCLSV